MDFPRVADRADANAAPDAEIEVRCAERNQPSPLHASDDIAFGMTEPEPPQTDVAHEA